MNSINQFLFLIIIFSLFSCNEEPESNNNVDSSDSLPNILLIIADDLGKDALNGFSEESIKPNTPNIDDIRNLGLSFTNFWSYPACTPTRASILTGKYGYRTGVKWVGDILDPVEMSLQKYINDQTGDKYSTAIVGKWHVSGNNSSINPESFGIDYYAGLISGGVQNYYNWQLSENGESRLETEYTTTKLTDLAIDWVSEQEKPWFMWLAYNAPHTPFHAPPNEMHSQGNLPDFTNGMTEMPYYMAAIEAMDFQIGRMLESIPPDDMENTIIVFLGDNGTPGKVAQRPYSRSAVKGTLYQGGINVPMFISGKGVTRIGEDLNLCTSSDLFATIAEFTGVSATEIHDSRSLKPALTENVTIRDYIYSEMYSEPIDMWAISNGKYKLIENQNEDQEFYDLNNDPYEKSNLMTGALTIDQSNAKAELEREGESIRQ